ncbi:MAG: glycosyltransferase family 39 protein, partial [Candidatus Hydrothermarchaeaceae archaeon]
MNTRASYLSLSALILASYALLYRFRALDRNTLFGWDEIFKTGMAEIFLLFISCLLLSYVISKAKFEINEKWDVPVLFLGAFLLGAVFWSAPEIHPDAGRYFAEAKYVEEYGALSFIRDWGGELNVMSDFPAVPFIYGLIFRFVGESKTYIQIFVTSLFAATSVLTYLIGRGLWNRDTGIYAALFLLSFPYLLSYTFTLPLILLTFFLTAAVYATLNALNARRGRIWIALSALFILLTVLSKASGVLLLSVIPAIFLASYLRAKDRTVLYRSASIALLSGALILLFVLYKFDVLVGIFPLLQAFKLRTLESHEASLSLLFFQISPL